MCGCACLVCLLLFRTCDFYPMCMLGVYYCGEHATSILCADVHVGCVYYCGEHVTSILCADAHVGCVYYCGEHTTSILCVDVHVGCVYYYVEMRLQSYVRMHMLGVFITVENM